MTVKKDRRQHIKAPLSMLLRRRQGAHYCPKLYWSYMPSLAYDYPLALPIDIMVADALISLKNLSLQGVCKGYLTASCIHLNHPHTLDWYLTRKEFHAKSFFPRLVDYGTNNVEYYPRKDQPLSCPPFLNVIISSFLFSFPVLILVVFYHLFVTLNLEVVFWMKSLDLEHRGEGVDVFFFFLNII